MMAGNELEKTLKKDLQEFTVRDADNVMGFLVCIPNIISYAIKNNQVAETKKVLVKTCDVLKKLDAMKSIPKPLSYMMCSPAYLDDDALEKHLYDVWGEYCDSGLADIVNEIILLNKKCYAKVDRISFYGPPTMTIYPGNNKKYVCNCYSSLMFERIMETGEMPSFTKVGYKGLSRSVEYDEKTGRMIKDIFPGKIFAEDYYEDNGIPWYVDAVHGSRLSDFDIRLLYLANKEGIPVCSVDKSEDVYNTHIYLYANAEHKNIVQSVMSISCKRLWDGVLNNIRDGYAYKNEPQIINDSQKLKGTIIKETRYGNDYYRIYQKNKYFVVEFPVYENEFYRIPVNDRYPHDFVSQLFFPVIEKEARKAMRKIELVEELPEIDR